ncbi:hypothetical protein B0H13DRAFT_1859328 [Mycena leptocephala]|nr:hypothetical protein B0H13DRAFT_1859328 [Mycena leptocephala]
MLDTDTGTDEPFRTGGTSDRGGGISDKTGDGRGGPFEATRNIGGGSGNETGSSRGGLFEVTRNIGGDSGEWKECRRASHTNIPCIWPSQPLVGDRACIHTRMKMRIFDIFNLLFTTRNDERIELSGSFGRAVPTYGHEALEETKNITKMAVFFLRNWAQEGVTASAAARAGTLAAARAADAAAAAAAALEYTQSLLTDDFLTAWVPRWLGERRLGERRRMGCGDWGNGGRWGGGWGNGGAWDQPMTEGRGSGKSGLRYFLSSKVALLLNVALLFKLALLLKFRVRPRYLAGVRIPLLSLNFAILAQIPMSRLSSTRNGAAAACRQEGLMQILLHGTAVAPSSSLAWTAPFAARQLLCFWLNSLVMLKEFLLIL